jgi:hypothetical protein
MTVGVEVTVPSRAAMAGGVEGWEAGRDALVASGREAEGYVV